MIFDWFKKKYKTDLIELIEDYVVDGDENNHYIPSIVYKIKSRKENRMVGRCDLRIGMDEELYYAGNIGYHIRPDFRGQGYGYEAAKLLLEIATTEYLMKEVIITCNPSNEASRKICQKLGGFFEGITQVPKDHWLSKQGDFEKCIFKYSIGRE